MKPKCKRCGQCCYLIAEWNILGPCDFLHFEEDGTTKCVVYATRIGKKLYFRSKLFGICRYRKDTVYDYPGCPYNTDKPIFRIIKDIL